MLGCGGFDLFGDVLGVAGLRAVDDQQRSRTGFGCSGLGGWLCSGAAASIVAAEIGAVAEAAGCAGSEGSPIRVFNPARNPASQAFCSPVKVRPRECEAVPCLSDLKFVSAICVTVIYTGRNGSGDIQDGSGGEELIETGQSTELFAVDGILMKNQP